MRLSRLSLQAFGPFTAVDLDFSHPARLHLVYGLNEAGKSSALRAISDLRFGIPERSPDNFIHDYRELRIAGVFCDATGQTIGLMRRKGRGQTLSAFDPRDGRELERFAEHEYALTGGLEREDFEAMFGLNHARLRAGGQRLLQGEGELGSALFEASAGTRGIKDILADLEQDAKALFSPRSSQATINRAQQTLDEQRRIWREAQIRPAEWQTLQRQHDSAQAELNAITQKLETLRRQDKQLTELRAVEPLLREYDGWAAELDTLTEIPDLPIDAQKQRETAEQTLSSAAQQRQKLDAELQDYATTLAELRIEPQILEYAAAIERLVAGVEPAAQAQIEIRRLATGVDTLAQSIEELATRMAPGRRPDELQAALPSAAERASLDEHLEQVWRLDERLAHDQHQLSELEHTLTETTGDDSARPDAAKLRTLRQALRHALDLGDVRRQQREWQQQIAQWRTRLDQALIDLNSPSLDKLQSARPLLTADIDQARQTLNTLEDERRSNREEDERLIQHLATQELSRERLMVTGEVITAATLNEARQHRDRMWETIRQRPDEVSSEALDHFGQAVRETDRQADMLRADAERVAKLAECELRIRQMHSRRQELTEEHTELAAQRQAFKDDWHARLTEAGLPVLSPEALNEWQGQRLRVLERAASGAALPEQLAQLQADSATAAMALSQARQGMGCHDTAVDDPITGLASLIRQAEHCVEHAREAEAEAKANRQLAQRQRRQYTQLQKKITEAATEQATHRAALSDWSTRLFLPADSPPSALKARLAELDQWQRLVQEHRDAQHQQAQQQALCADVQQRATQLADWLALPAPEPEQAGAIEAFAQGLYQRLLDSREQQQQRQHVLDNQHRAQARQQEAQQVQHDQNQILTALCQAAGVEQLADLPAVETAAARKRELQQKLAESRQRIAQTSSRDWDALRTAVAGRDTLAIDSECARCHDDIRRLQAEQDQAREAEEHTRHALHAIDSSDRAAAAREAMESAAASYRAALRPWARLRLARALLSEALTRFRDKAQAPMVAAASAYFALMTGGRYTRLVADDQDGQPLLQAERADGQRIGVAAMSEGTADQLYLALRLAALHIRRESHPAMPLVLDDVLITADDERAACMLQALADFAQDDQVLLFTHHRHVVELAQATLGDQSVAVQELKYSHSS